MHLSQTFSFKRTERACEEGSGGVREARGGAGQDQRLAQHQQVGHLYHLSACGTASTSKSYSSTNIYLGTTMISINK